MGRSGYAEADDCENVGLWRAAVARAINGKRGQAFLREMADALDAMPVKELVADEVVRDDGHVCAIGAVAVARKLSVVGLDVYDQDEVARTFGIARALAAEIAFENDDDFSRHRSETPAQRWQRMREWVDAQLLPET